MGERNHHIYEGFAYSYDLFMDNIPYDAWAGYLHSLLQEYGVQDGVVLELGCGTGNMTGLMAARGYDMIGLDCSGEMLELARAKYPAQILFLQQDMRGMELYGTVSAIYCVCDGMNYLLEPQDLQMVFEKANTYLEPGGVFVFDMKTKYFYKNILGDRMIAENREDASFLWDNEYHEESAVNEYLLTVYQLEDEEAGLFSRYDEMHFQKAYDIKQVQELVEAAGMEFVAVYDAFTRKPPGEASERLYFVVREQYQEGKFYDK